MCNLYFMSQINVLNQSHTTLVFIKLHGYMFQLKLQAIITPSLNANTEKTYILHNAVYNIFCIEA
jgi:hypothetical protein